MGSDGRELTPKQAAFVAEYLIDLNASAAARRAGYSERTAEWQGPQLLGKTHVADAIAAAQAERAQRTQIDADWVLRRLAAMADADLSDLHNEDGTLKPVSEWPDVWRKGLIAGVETEEIKLGGEPIGQVRKVKIADRLKALELIGRHVAVGAWREKVEHSGPGGGPIQSVSMTPDEFRAIAADVAGRV